jgi:hypothetical protein
VDIWEDNRCVHLDGVEYLHQTILWRWEWQNGVKSYYVMAWALDAKCRQPERIRGRWIGLFNGKLVSPRLIVQTTTCYDPELEDRKRLPESKRSWKK